MPQDYLCAETWLLEALKAGLMQPGNGQVKAVMGLGDLAQVMEQAQFTPAVHVLYAGESPESAGQLADESGYAFAQRWMVVVAVRTAASNSQKATPVNAEAGPLISQVLGLILGKRPGTVHTPFKRAAAPAPIYQGSFAYYPLVFSTTALGCIDF